MAAAVSGSNNSAPIKKAIAPTKVNASDRVVASKGKAWGVTKANRAEAINAMQPIRLIPPAHQEIWPGF